MSQVKNPFTVDSLRLLKYETPYLLIDLNRLEKRYFEFKKYYSGAALYYAVKCNSELGLIRKLHQLGSGFEVASYNEYLILNSLNVPNTKIVFSAPIKSPTDIKAAYEAGIDRFAADCPSEIEKIAKNAPGAKVYIRFTVNHHGSKWPLSLKFGADPSTVVGLLRYASKLGLQTYGITFHVGSQAKKTKSWRRAIQTAGKLMKDLETHNIRIEMLDLGGGFPARYTKDVLSLEKISRAINSALKKYIPYDVEYMIEPGRGLVGEAGVLVSSVIARTKRGRANWLYLDVGAYNGLIETQSTQGSLCYPLRTSKDETRGNNKKLKFVVTGPTCDNLDTMFSSVRLSKDIDVGDHVYIGSAGAYTVSYASSFNGFKPPKVYYAYEDDTNE